MNPLPYHTRNKPVPEKPKHWPRIILVGFLILILIFGIFWLVDYYRDKKAREDLQNYLNNQGIAVGEPNSAACNEDLYNCGDFTTQAAAQAVFDVCVDNGAGDIHQLDGDGNGRACEGLP